MKSEVRIPWFHYFANGVFRVLSRLLLDLHVKGLECSPKQGPLIVAINRTFSWSPLWAPHLSDRMCCR